MNPEPLVSIILPTFNRSTLLPRSIGSVLKQTYQNWELIIWDDGSTDNTKAIINTYIDERIRYFRDENHGAAYARNRALETSHGEFIAFLDSDDEWASEKLKLQLNHMQNFPEIDVLFTNFQNINTITQKSSLEFSRYANALQLLNTEKLSEGLYLIESGFLECLATVNIIATDTIFSRREIFERVDPFSEDLRNSEDFELWWRMGLAGIKFAYIEKPLLTRYKPADSLSSNTIATYENHLKVLRKCIEGANLKGRLDLIPYLKPTTRNAWMNLIPLYAEIGDNKGMINAFNNSIRRGFTLGALRLLIQSSIKSLLSSGKN